MVADILNYMTIIFPLAFVVMLVANSISPQPAPFGEEGAVFNRYTNTFFVSFSFLFVETQILNLWGSTCR